MNLKEAFRFQNKLKELLSDATDILENDRNVVCVETTKLRSKVCEGAENETSINKPNTEFADHITDIARFAMYIIAQREELSRAIREAKSRLDIDIDGEACINSSRQSLAQVFRNMAGLTNSSEILSGMATGYRFNQEGNQVSYRCDLKKVTTINFDRKAVRNFAAELNRKSDAISMEIDRRMVNTEVWYEVPFDVNDSFGDVFTRFIGVEEV